MIAWEYTQKTIKMLILWITKPKSAKDPFHYSTDVRKFIKNIKTFVNRTISTLAIANFGTKHPTVPQNNKISTCALLEHVFH